MDGCPTTESGLSTCYGKAPLRRGFPMRNAVIDLPYAALRRHMLARTLSRHTIAPLQAAALAIVADRGEAQGR